MAASHRDHIRKGRTEALSDGVIAIVITIIVLQLPVPESSAPEELAEFGRNLFIYLVAFFHVGIEWYKHRALLDRLPWLPRSVVLWNLVFLFFVSLVPLFTSWAMASPSELVPAVGYLLLTVLIEASFLGMGHCATVVGPQKELARLRLRERASELMVGALAVGVVAGVLIHWLFPGNYFVLIMGAPLLIVIVGTFGFARRHENLLDDDADDGPEGPAGPDGPAGPLES